VDLDAFRAPAGRIIRVGAGEVAYEAFVPHPLPPALELDDGLIRRLSAADRRLGELAGLCRAMPGFQLFVQPFIRREAVLSSRIEGTTAGITDLYAYEAGQLPLFPHLKVPPESEIREVLNYIDTLQYGLERLQTLPVSLRLIRELHARLMEGVRGGQAYPGEFRRSQNRIGPPGRLLREATYVPPPVPEMHEALAALERYIHSEDRYPPLVRLGFIHYQFEAIHPFVDGNGRIGRLLLALLLVAWDLLPQPVLYLSAFFERHRTEYYDALLAVSTRSAWRDWLDFFLRGVAEEAGDTVTKARRLQDLQTEWRGKLASARASGFAFRLLDGLFAAPILTTPRSKKFWA